ncbi:MAG TPA: hypothetical protein VLI72_05860 [Methylibium sp.]|nr:hypothetical protein [Methylibium sp.]
MAVTGRVSCAWRIACALVVVAASGCQRQDAPSPVAASAAVSAEVERIVGACVTAMVQSTCQVVRDRSGPPPPEATVVFVAGVGPVDATAYNAIRAAGEEMCNTVKAACVQSWEGPQCRTARSLWGAAPQTR